MSAPFSSGHCLAQQRPLCVLLTRCSSFKTCNNLAQVAKELADSVIPNEYGIDPEGKLKIGSKICANLLGKVLSDLQNMREESLATAVSEEKLLGGFRIFLTRLSSKLKYERDAHLQTSLTSMDKTLLTLSLLELPFPLHHCLIEEPACPGL